MQYYIQNTDRKFERRVHFSGVLPRILSKVVLPQDNEEKQFIYRHSSRTVFDLLDGDGSKAISAEEFATSGFLFNFQGAAVKKIFQEFDVWRPANSYLLLTKI